MSLWIPVAKNEIRLKTSRFRKNRKLFFIVIFSIFLLWSSYLGPILIDAILPEIIKIFSSNYVGIIIPLIEYTFSTLFLMYVMYPLFILFRKAEIGYKEIILASPIKRSDIILGEFIGRLPFYALLILGIGPFGITLILQINPEMNIFHYLIFYLIFFSLSIFGSFIGTILANWVEFRIARSEKIKELRSIFLILLAILVLIIFYSFQYLFGLFRTYPEFKNFLLFYPSLWYSNIILYLIDPKFIELSLFNIWVNIGLAIIIPLLSFYFFYKISNYTYDLNFEFNKKFKIIHKEHKFYNFIKRITHKNYKGLVVIHFKEFFRKKQNKVKLVYIIGVISMFSIFLYLALENQPFVFETSFLGIPIIIQIILNQNVLMLLISWMGSFIFGILMGMSAFVDSKDVLFVYKKSPMGLKAFLQSYLYEMVYILLLIDIFFTILFTFIFILEILVSLTFFFIFMINSIIIIIQAIGIQCIRPLFEERRKNMIFNNYYLLALQVLSLFITLYLIIPVMIGTIDTSSGLFLILLINIGISTGLASLIFSFGIHNLKKIE
ncbi:MAG: hypothetical protein ACFE9X_01610 [Promethearchaeota archaeon]